MKRKSLPQNLEGGWSTKRKQLRHKDMAYNSSLEAPLHHVSVEDNTC